jgi:hypothetical protein
MKLFTYNETGIISETDDVSKFESYRTEATNKGYKTIESDIFPPFSKKLVNGDLIDKTRFDKIQDGTISIEQLKIEKNNEISEQAGKILISGYQSSVLGEPYLYDTELVDQFNFKITVDIGIDTTYRCLKISDNKKNSYPHTSTQLRQIYFDYIIHTRFILQKANDMKLEIANINDPLLVENYSIIFN